MTCDALFKCDHITFLRKYITWKRQLLLKMKDLWAFFIIKAEFDTLVPQLFFFINKHYFYYIVIIIMYLCSNSFSLSTPLALFVALLTFQNNYRIML